MEIIFHCLCKGAPIKIKSRLHTPLLWSCCETETAKERCYRQATRGSHTLVLFLQEGSTIKCQMVLASPRRWQHLPVDMCIIIPAQNYNWSIKTILVRQRRGTESCHNTCTEETIKGLEAAGFICCHCILLRLVFQATATFVFFLFYMFICT